MKFFRKHLPRNSVKTRGAFLIGATIFGNFFNFLFNAYLGRAISVSDFALISVLASILSLTDVIMSGLGKSVTYKAAYILGKHNQIAYEFWRNVRKKAILGSFITAFIWILFIPYLNVFFNIYSKGPLLMIAPVWIIGILIALDGGYLKGSFKFSIFALSGVVEAVSKFLFALLFVKLNHTQYVYLSIPLSMATSFAILWIAAENLKINEKRSPRIENSFPWKFLFSSIFSKISTVVYLSTDVILAKHFLSSDDAGRYALLSLTGKMIYFAGSLFSQFIIPVASRDEGAGKNSGKNFNLLLLATFLTSMAAFTVVGVFGNYSMPILFGKNALPIIPYVALYTLAMVAFSISSNIISYHQIKNQHILPFVSFLLAIVQVFGILTFHDSIGSIANVMIYLGFISLFVTLLIHYLYKRIIVVTNNFLDFIDLFSYEKTQSIKTGELRMLIFNWRDTKHVWAGGAEVYIHELAKRFVKDGNQVTIFCGNDSMHKRNQVIEGVRIIRRGGFYTVYLWAMLYYIFKLRNNYDIIIDSENGIPFFTPLFSRKPIVLLIHHVHQDVFVNHMRFPLSYIGRFIEGRIMPFLYKHRLVITVSESSKKEIIKAKIADEARIEIINPGVVASKFKKEKTKYPSFVYLGRLKAYKNVDIAIKAFSEVLKKYPNAEFYVVGEGECLSNLKDLAKKMKIDQKVQFFGKVSEAKKIELLAKSWAAIQPSDIEGWGITVIEANSCGTPVIASNVNGLRDSVINGKTGLLFKVRDTKELALNLNKIIENRGLRNKLSRNAFVWAKNFSWNTQTDDFFQLLQTEIKVKRAGQILPSFPIQIFNRN